MWDTTMYYDDNSVGHSVRTDLAMAIKLHKTARKLGYKRIVTVRLECYENAK